MSRSESSPPARAGTGAEAGSTLVEFALVAPLVMALALAVFTGGAAYVRKIALIDSVRDGARYGSTLPLGTGAGAAAAWEDRVRSRVVGASGGELTAADVCVRLALPSGGNDCGVSDPPGSSSESTVHVVKVSAVKPAEVHFLFFSTNRTLTARLAARYERDE